MATEADLPDVTTSLLNREEKPVKGESEYKDVQSSKSRNENASEERVTCMLALSIFASVIGCSFQFGIQTGILNTPQQLLQREYAYGFEEAPAGGNDTTLHKQLSDEQVVLLWSVTVSIFGVGGMIAGFTGSYFATKLGRKKMMLLNNILLLIGVGAMVMARYVKLLGLIIAGRAILGLNSGFGTVVAPLYLNEISPVTLRGGVGTIHQLAITSGILISQVLGVQQIFGNRDLYHLLFGFPIIAGLLQVIILPFCPESPSWLYITKLKHDKSKASLQSLRGDINIDPQLVAYSAEVEDQQLQAKITFKSMFTRRHLRTPLMIAVVMQLSQQFSGIIAILNYSTSIFTSVGLAEDDAQYATLGTTGAIVTMTIISVLFMDRIGRRPLHLGGLSGCLLSMILITVALFIQEKYDWAKYLSIVALVLFIISFAIGPGSIPWFITAELFDQAARPYAISLATLVNWSANFLSGLIFPHMQRGLGYYTFVPFIILLTLFVIFTYFKVPETKNKSTEEIVSMFQQRGGTESAAQLDEIAAK